MATIEDIILRFRQAGHDAPAAAPARGLLHPRGPLHPRRPRPRPHRHRLLHRPRRRDGDRRPARRLLHRQGAGGPGPTPSPTSPTGIRRTFSRASRSRRTSSTSPSRTPRRARPSPWTCYNGCSRPVAIAIERWRVHRAGPLPEHAGPGHVGVPRQAGLHLPAPRHDSRHRRRRQRNWHGETWRSTSRPWSSFPTSRASPPFPS